MENPSVISPGQMKDKNQIHRDLIGKVKKLEGYDIYVGAGYSEAGEPMFFAMEKLDSQNVQVWKDYADALYQTAGIIAQLFYLSINCQKEEYREELKQEGDFYRIGLMDLMCSNRLKFMNIFSEGGTRAGINGFNEMLVRQRGGKVIYGAYASTQPIIGPFKPKKKITIISPVLQEFEEAYSDIIISVAVDMIEKTSKTEHRGIFKNPFFEIQGTYKNIAMKLHGWAGTVEEQVFHKKYMTLFPTSPAAELLHRVVKPGDMYIGIDTNPYPYDDEELRKKFPSIKQDLIGNQSSLSFFERLHVFELNLLSKYYTELPEKK